MLTNLRKLTLSFKAACVMPTSGVASPKIGETKKFWGEKYLILGA